jgi:hypothetical protein
MKLSCIGNLNNTDRVANSRQGFVGNLDSNLIFILQVEAIEYFAPSEFSG